MALDLPVASLAARSSSPELLAAARLSGLADSSSLALGFSH
jgi:hypothetical protein